MKYSCKTDDIYQTQNNIMEVPVQLSPASLSVKADEAITSAAIPMYLTRTFMAQ